MARPGNENTILQSVIDNDKIRHESDAFTTAITVLCNAANEASQQGLCFFDSVMKCAMEQQSQTLLGSGSTEELKCSKKRAKLQPRGTDPPNKPITSYFLFRPRDGYTVSQNLGSGATEKEISDEISERWDETSEDRKQARKNIYKRNWEPYVKDMALYKASKASQCETDNSESTTESDGKDEEEAEPEEEIKSPSPTPRKMPNPRAIKSVATKRNTKKALDMYAASGTSTRAKPATPAVVGTNDQAEPANRSIVSTGKGVEAERDSDKLTHKRIEARRWRRRCD